MSDDSDRRDGREEPHGLAITQAAAFVCSKEPEAEFANQFLVIGSI
jgi:hypothetical protein